MTNGKEVFMETNRNIVSLSKVHTISVNVVPFAQSFIDASKKLLEFYALSPSDKLSKQEKQLRNRVDALAMSLKAYVDAEQITVG